MPRDRKDSLNITQPMMVFNPVKLYQMEALYEMIKKFSVIDQFTTKCLIWLLEHTERLALPACTQVSGKHRFVCDDVRHITEIWHLNQVLKCMDTFMRLYCLIPTDEENAIIQISPKPIINPHYLKLNFDPEKIMSIAL